MELSVIIVNYNTKHFLAGCLASIYANSLDKKAYEVIVVDNCSTDGSAESLRKQYPRVSWIRLRKNVGFARANNIGVSKTGASKYIFFLNPDTRLEQQALEKLLSFMRRSAPQVGIVGPYIKLPSGKIDDACHRGFPTPWNALTHFSGLGRLLPHSLVFNGYHLGYRRLSEIHAIDACAGAAMLVRRDCGSKLGWWDEDYFWYGEDLDFCYRAKQNGWQVIFYPFAAVLHYKGVAGGIKKHSQAVTTADKPTKLLAQNARFAAMEIFYRKHYRQKYPKVVMWSILALINLFKFFQLLQIYAHRH